MGDAWAKRIQDMDELKMLRQEAEEGNAKAMRKLGSAYREGKLGLAKDQIQAAKFFTQGANKEDALAMGRLSDTMGDTKEGVYWRTLAAMNGVEHSCFVLGRKFQLGLQGWTKNSDQARKWFKNMQTCRCKNASEDQREKASKFLQEADVVQ